MNFKTALLLLFAMYTHAQKVDSSGLISEVQIDAYRKPAKFITSTKSVAVAQQNLLNQNSADRLLESINLLPGSRMEERSPGSYRFSVRGSTLRSPFGVRNVKVYLDDFPLSDASGNTYLNVIDPHLLSEIEIYKGPEGGDFGAATGGTALLRTAKSDKTNFSLAGGRYNHFKGAINHSKAQGNHFYQIYSSYQTTDSYRDQAALERKFLFLKDRFIYARNNQFHAMVLLSDLHYETPGGLTVQQMTANPRQARPKTPATPGAEEQQAGIYNKMIFAGVSNLLNLTDNFSHFVAVHGSYSDFRNPFITNYEKRFENNVGFRTHLNFERSNPKSFFQTRVGFEGASARNLVRNFDNNFGVAADPQNFDNIFTQSGFVFLSQKAEFSEKLSLDLSGSLNLTNYRWESLFPAVESGAKKFKNDFLPSLGVSYLISNGFSVRGKISKGNSTPTTEEIRSSAQEINPDLEAEFGWNKEIGIRKQWGNLLFTEVSIFDFQLKNAIVRRENSEGQEFFVNAGETVQQGLEFILETKKLSINSSFLSSLKFYVSGNLYDFRFRNYQKNEDNFSGNKLTGVPTTSLQNLINIEVLNKIRIDIAHFYTSSTPLNDSNSVVAEPSFVGNISVNYPITVLNSKADLQLRVQNIYDTKYSLGYDINAFGNRFFNPAAPRNYMIGMNLQLK